MKKYKVLSTITSLQHFGGAEKILVDVHNGLKEFFDSKIICTHSFKKVNPKLEISKEDYISFMNPYQLQDSVLLVHARNILPFIITLKKIFFLNTKIIYISHNVYNTYRKLTLFPENIISISNKVTDNLISYFGIKKSQITLINNGIIDLYKNQDFTFKLNKKIKILYPARVNFVKRQLEIVKHLKNRISNNIEIHFAGIGEDSDELNKICINNLNFKALGFVNNIHKIINNYDFVMLYSLQEGLPISLIEGIMHAKPLLINDVGGNLEIGIPQKNAIVLSSSWDEMTDQLNQLEKLSCDIYTKMAANSRNLFLEKYQYNKMINSYNLYIDKIIRSDEKINI